MKNYKVISLSDMLENEDDDNVQSKIKNFKCSKEKELESFLSCNAIPYEKMEYGKTFLILNEDSLVQKKKIDIIAFFTIGQKSLDIGSLSQKKKRKVLGNIPGRDHLKSIPAFLIGQIGRCDDYDTNDLPGSIILDECYYQIKQARSIVGGKLIILECRPKMFNLFYKDQDFVLLNNSGNTNKLITLYKKI